jgi:hypothetical protein
MGRTGDAIKVLAVTGLIASPTLAQIVDGCRAVVVNGTVCQIEAPDPDHGHEREQSAPSVERGPIAAVNASGGAGGHEPSTLEPRPGSMSFVGYAPDVWIA